MLPCMLLTLSLLFILRLEVKSTGPAGITGFVSNERRRETPSMSWMALSISSLGRSPSGGSREDQVPGGLERGESAAMASMASISLTSEVWARDIGNVESAETKEASPSPCWTENGAFFHGTLLSVALNEVVGVSQLSTNSEFSCRFEDPTPLKVWEGPSTFSPSVVTMPP